MYIRNQNQCKNECHTIVLSYFAVRVQSRSRVKPSPAPDQKKKLKTSLSTPVVIKQQPKDIQGILF